MSIINQQKDVTLRKNESEKKLVNEITSSLLGADNDLNEEYSYSKHLKSPLTSILQSITTNSAFTSEFDYSRYSLSDQDTIVTLGPEKKEKEKMNYFGKESSDATIKQNTPTKNSDKEIDEERKECCTKKKDLFDDSAYDIYSYDSYYQSQSLQTYCFY